MKTNTYTPRYSTIGCWLLCLLVLLLCTSFNAAAKSSTAYPLAYSGETLFRGIFLADGPVAEVIPEIKDLRHRRYVKDRKLLEQIQSIHDGIVATVKQKYPAYMPGLEQAVASKNPVKINQKIKEGKTILKEVLESMGFQPDVRAMHAALEDLSKKNGQVSLEDLKRDVMENMKNYSNMLQAKEATQELVWCLIAYCHVVVYIVVPTEGVEEANNLLDERMASSLAQL